MHISQLTVNMKQKKNLYMVIKEKGLHFLKIIIFTNIAKVTLIFHPHSKEIYFSVLKNNYSWLALIKQLWIN